MVSDLLGLLPILFFAPCPALRHLLRIQMAHAATRTPATAVQRGSATRHRRTGAPTRPRLGASSTTHTIKWRLSSAKRVAELDDEGLAWSVAQLRAEAYFEESTNRFKKSLERKYAQREEEALLAHLRLKPGAKCWDGSNVKVCLLVHGDQSNDDVIGALDVSLRDDWVYLDNVCVSEASRRRGVASALVRAAAEKAAGWGVHAVYAHVVKGNTPAEACYARLGFVDSNDEARHTVIARALPHLPPGARLIQADLPLS